VALCEALPPSLCPIVVNLVTCVIMLPQAYVKACECGESNNLAPTNPIFLGQGHHYTDEAHGGNLVVEHTLTVH